MNRLQKAFEKLQKEEELKKKKKKKSPFRIKKEKRLQYYNGWSRKGGRFKTKDELERDKRLGEFLEKE